MRHAVHKYLIENNDAAVDLPPGARALYVDHDSREPCPAPACALVSAALLVLAEVEFRPWCHELDRWLDGSRFAT